MLEEFLVGRRRQLERLQWKIDTGASWALEGRVSGGLLDSYGARLARLVMEVEDVERFLAG